MLDRRLVAVVLAAGLPSSPLKHMQQGSSSVQPDAKGVSTELRIQCPACSSVVPLVTPHPPLSQMTLADLWFVTRRFFVYVGACGLIWAFAAASLWVGFTAEAAFGTAALGSETPDWLLGAAMFVVALWLCVTGHIPFGLRSVGGSLVQVGWTLARGGRPTRLAHAVIFMGSILGLAISWQATLTVLLVLVAPVFQAIAEWRERVGELERTSLDAI